MIQCRNISKTYGNSQALSDINLNIKTGKITGIIGENGAGKSTLMKILATSIIDYQGEIFFDEKNLGTNINNLRNQIGYMPDQYGLYQDINIFEYLSFILELNNEVINKQKIIEILKTVELNDFMYHNINNLSRGMTQRVLLAQSIICNPKILILDEPASGLDPKLRILLHNILMQLKNKGVTIIISSHILNELENLVDEIIVIHNGKISFHDTIEKFHKNQSSNIYIQTTKNDLAIEIILNKFPKIEFETIENAIIIKNNSSSQQILGLLIENNITVLGFQSQYKSMQNAYISLTQ